MDSKGQKVGFGAEYMYDLTDNIGCPLFFLHYGGIPLHSAI